MNQILRTLLYEWRERKLPAVIRRDTQVDIRLQPGTNNAAVITGFRRVGKTYLLYEAIEELLKTQSRQEVVYINFEDERIIPPTTNLLTDLLPEIQAVFGKKPRFLFLDELQLVPNWSKWVRRILDTETIQLFITGSSSKMSSAELPTELRGRAWEVKVIPLSFVEFLRFKQTSIDFEKVVYVKDELARFQFLFDEYLTYGALPAVVLTAVEKKQELLQSYFQTVVQRDIAERYKIGNDIALKTLLKLLLNSSYITISKLHNNLKSMNIPVGKSTIQNYLSYIESSYFMDELYIHNPAVINQLQVPRKVYFVDTGFMTALSTKFSKNTERLFENVMFRKLAQENETVHYYKDDKGNEVDFVILSEGRATALYQVCANLIDEETQKREVRSLIKAGATLNCQNLNLVMIEKPDTYTPPQEIKLISAAEFIG
ncbi:MAG: AAA family ATPase [Candidatus Pacebacteria bacterium CG_4_10_14_0_8_um_filter_43_12]|nr:MAG: AAA family ATPase [Candidatus Pacebacteria bacterium CG10_big_fil_rev_8_21_14_0_10_44_11]PIY79758.1 MAG: AAA family ATPase [Candidatus Pacebacteria bacterium CG_4_10_14_0_8_um_filter_43_12]